MAVPLQSVSSRLQILSSKLGHDPDIQIQMKNISKNARTTAESFKSAMSKGGGRILLEKTLLLTGCTDKTSIENLQSALKNGNELLSASRENVTCIQTDIQSSGDICSTRIASYESDLEDVLTKISRESAEIINLRANISSYEDEATAASSKAFELQEKAAIKTKAFEKDVFNASVTGIAGGLVGMVLAPFTDGQSLSMASAGKNNQSHVDERDRVMKKASRLSNEAKKYSKEAKKLKAKKSELETKRRILNTEMGAIQTSIDGVKEAANVLRQVSSFLLPTMNTIDSLLRAIQDMDTCLDDVYQKRNSCEIIKNAFAVHPKMEDGASALYLRQIGDRWKRLEELLSQHGVFGL